VKYITAMFVFLVFNASWQWWAIMCALMMFEIYAYCTTFWKEYKKQKGALDMNFKSKPMTKKELEEIWNNGYATGMEQAQLRKH